MVYNNNEYNDNAHIKNTAGVIKQKNLIAAVIM